MKKTGLEHFHFRMQGFAGNRILPLPPSLHSGPDPVCSSGQAGILVIPPEDILKTHQDILRRIRQASGMDADSYARLMQPVILRYLQNVHLLPATREQGFSHGGGLFRLGLEGGFFSMQGVDGVIFSHGPRMRILEPRWKYAAFLCGLCLEWHRCLSGMSITDIRGEAWFPFGETLWEWARSRQRYFVLWEPEVVPEAEKRACTAFILSRIVERCGWHYLDEGSPQIIRELMLTITGSVPGEADTRLGRIVRPMLARVMQREQGRFTGFPLHPVTDACPAPRVLMAMQKLVQKGIWTINQDNAPIWYSKEGLFLVWSRAVEDLHLWLDPENGAGLSPDQDGLCVKLIEAQVFLADGNRPYWGLVLPGCCEEVAGVRFARPELFLETGDRAIPLPLENLLSRHRIPQETGRAFSLESAGNTGGQEDAADAVSEEEGVKVQVMTCTAGTPLHLPEAGFGQKVSTGCADMLEAVAREKHCGNSSGVAIHREGLAISLPWIFSHAENGMDVIRELWERGWLYRSSLTPEVKAYPVEMAGKTESCIILTGVMARELGLCPGQGAGKTGYHEA